MIVNLSEEVRKDSFLGWAVCVMMGDRYREVYAEDKPGPQASDVHFSINGIELDTVEVWQRLQDDFERNVRAEARHVAADLLNRYVEVKLKEMFPDIDEADL